MVPVATIIPGGIYPFTITISAFTIATTIIPGPVPVIVVPVPVIITIAIATVLAVAITAVAILILIAAIVTIVAVVILVSIVSVPWHPGDRKVLARRRCLAVFPTRTSSFLARSVPT